MKTILALFGRQLAHGVTLITRERAIPADDGA
jgi:hypothetical protein